MTRDREYGGLDAVKLAAAVLVICIHTSPLSSFSADADFFLTRIASRLAVPFFMMVTGFFVLPQYLFERKNVGTLLRFIKKTAVLYAVAAALYLPVNFYAGQFAGLDAAGVLRLIFFDGTFYHLWYLPAVILGVMLLYLLSRKLSFKAVFNITLLLYLIGLAGDSYYGAISGVPFLSGFYNAVFTVSSYTRNGLFYAPVFLAIGALMGQPAKTRPAWINAVGLAVSFGLMTAEGFILHRLDWQRHDSMYLFLLPCMFFLFSLALSWQRKANPAFRIASTWIYILHPLFIVAVRGAVKATGLAEILVQNSLIHFLAVTACSVAAASVIVLLQNLFKKRTHLPGRAWIELDQAALHHNVKTLRAMLPNGCELMPAVKANAYGHGAVLISRELNRLGVKAFCVATVEEGIELRRHGVKGMILILGYTHPEHFSLLRRYRLTQTVLDADYADCLNGYGKRLHVHVKLDTGMHRLGERCENSDGIARIFAFRNLKIDGIYTHLCVADDLSPEGRAFTQNQITAFDRAISDLKQRGYPCPKKHIAASYGLLNYPETAADYVRTGIALYGMLSTRADTERCKAALKPVLSLKARVAVVKHLNRGESAGYGLQYIAPCDAEIAVVSIGYADGIPRSLSCGVGAVLIHGKKAPIAGLICMDQLLADVTCIPEVKSGDVAVLIGQSGEEKITACDLAEQSETIANEILSRLGNRLERRLL